MLLGIKAIIKTVSIDMSTNDSNTFNHIYAKVIETQGDTLLCEFESANYDYENSLVIHNLENKIKSLEEEILKLKSLRRCGNV